MQELWQIIIQRLNLVELQYVSWEDIYVGISGNSSKIKGCNTVILMIKYMLYLMRAEGKVPKFNDVMKYFRECKEEENKIAVKRGIIGMHLLKWEYIC